MNIWGSLKVALETSMVKQQEQKNKNADPAYFKSNKMNTRQMLKTSTRRGMDTASRKHLKIPGTKVCLLPLHVLSLPPIITPMQAVHRAKGEITKS